MGIEALFLVPVVAGIVLVLFTSRFKIVLFRDEREGKEHLILSKGSLLRQNKQEKMVLRGNELFHLKRVTARPI